MSVIFYDAAPATDAPEPRNRYLRPAYLVHRKPQDPAGWPDLPAVAVFADSEGEEIRPEPVDLRLAWDDQALYLRARVGDPNPTLLSEIEPDDGRFWRQDHIEFRLVPDLTETTRQIQVLMTADGRYLDSEGLWKTPGKLDIQADRDEHGWSLSARLPFEALGLEPPEDGQALNGLVGYTRWADGWADVRCQTAVELGYNQPDRQGRLVLAGPAPQITLAGVDLPAGRIAEGPNEARIVLHNAAAEPVSTVLRVGRQDDIYQAGRDESCRLTLQPGRNEIPWTLHYTRPVYYRHTVRARLDGRFVDLGSFTLRAAVSDVPRSAMNLPHPRLTYTPEVLADIEAKLRNPAFAWCAEKLAFDPEKDLAAEGLDDRGKGLSLEYGPGDHLVRSGKRLLDRMESLPEPNPVRRLWQLLDASTRSAIKSQADGETADSQAIAAGLNAVLRRRDFHAPTDWQELDVPEDARPLLEVGIDKLDEQEVIRLNRVLIDGAMGFGPANVHLVRRAIGTLDKWLLSRDARLIDLATRCVRAANRYTTLTTRSTLHIGGLSSGLAVLYDTYCPHLSEEDRWAWHHLLGRFLQVHLNTARGRHWDSTCIPNANPVINGGGGMLALALLGEDDRATESLYLVRKLLGHHLDYCYSIDGGNTEGHQYWEYGMSNYFPFCQALEHTIGHDDGFLNHPAVTMGPNMLKMGISNDGKICGFNDTIPLPINTKVATMFATRTNDPLAMWWVDKGLDIWTDMERRGKKTAYSPDPVNYLTYRPNVPLCTDQPSLPTAYLLEGIQYSVMRSGSNYDCRLTAGLKGSRPYYTHHNQPDCGSYYIDCRGQKMLIDPGYYRGRPEDHSIPAIGGVNPPQPQDYLAEIVACVSRGSLRYLACDSTRAYGNAARRVRRHLVMVGEAGLVLLDDIMPTDPEAQILARYQTAWPTAAIGDGRGVTINGPDARMRLDVLTRPEMQLQLHDEKAFHEGWGYHFAECTWYPVSGTYRAEQDDPLVTTFLDVTDGDAGCAQVTREPRQLTVSLPGGQAIVFAYFDGLWALDLAASTT